jgi:hypothetical protein
LSTETEVRAQVFAHLRGIVLVPVVKALCDRGIFELFSTPGAWVDLDRIVAKTRANRGYLKVALRLLVSAGWLNWQNGTSFSLTPEGSAALQTPQLYREIAAFIPTAIFLEDFLFARSQERSQGSVPPALQTAHGIVIGPTMVALARKGILSRLQEGPLDLASIDGNQACLSALFDLLAGEGWVHREGNRISLTPAGNHAASFAYTYGITVSYLPMFSVVSTLMFGNPRIPRTDDNGVELLVNRAMNVWAAAGAHKEHFAKGDDILIEIFNRPLELQPAGVCDMGCGDGTFLEHVWNVIRERTARGKVLDEYPLLIVGADFNKVSRRVTKQNFKRAQIPHSHVISGDINRPALLAGDLEELGVDIHDLLHIRAFIDHNRSWLQPSGYVRGTRQGRSTGAFAHLGEEISADELEENLVRHLRRWAPYVGRFGLLALELHTIPPELAAANPSETPAVTYDAVNGFSDQYPVELQVFLECAREAGLHADRRFPSSPLQTVSVNFFTAPQA